MLFEVPTRGPPKAIFGILRTLLLTPMGIFVRLRWLPIVAYAGLRHTYSTLRDG